MAAEIILRVKVDRSQYNAFKKEVNKGLDAGGTNKVKDSLKETGEQAQQATSKIQSLGEMLTKKIAWYSISMAISSVTVAFKEALQEIKAVDTQLTNIKKVSDISAESLEKLADKAYSTASKYGVQASEYMEAVYEYTKAGFQDNADAMAELSTKAMLVGDTTAAVADKFLIAGNAAWKYEGNLEKLTLLVDKADYINNKYATTFDKIAEAFPRVASVASMAGMSAEETMAAIGTITATTQETASRASTALRALILNILGDTTTEVEDGVTTTVEEIESLRDALQKYAPDVVKAADATGSLINPMKALKALSEAYRKGDLTQSGLFEIENALGGKLRTNQLDALLKNFDMYEQMLLGMAGAAGTADKEISTMLESWEAKANILSNTWTEFISKGLSSDVFKRAIEWLTDLLERFGGLNEVLPIIGGAMAALFAPAIIGNIERMVGNVTNLKTALQTGFRTMDAETNTFKTNWNAVGTALSLGIAAVTTAIALYQNHIRKLKQQSQDAADEADALVGTASAEYTNILELYGEYKKAKSATDDSTESKVKLAEATENLALALGMEKEAIDEVNNSLDTNAEKELEKRKSTIQTAIDEDITNILNQLALTEYDLDRMNTNPIFAAGYRHQVRAEGDRVWTEYITPEQQIAGVADAYEKAKKQLDAYNAAFHATSREALYDSFMADEFDFRTLESALEAFDMFDKDQLRQQINTQRAFIEEASFIETYLNNVKAKAELEKAYNDFLNGTGTAEEVADAQLKVADAEAEAAAQAEAEAAAQEKLADAFKDVTGQAVSATEALEKYNAALEADQAEENADALASAAQAAFEAVEDKRVDSAEVKAFGDLWFNSDQIAKFKKEGISMADALMNDSNFKRIFIAGKDDEGNTIFRTGMEAAEELVAKLKEFDDDNNGLMQVLNGDVWETFARLEETDSGVRVIVEDWKMLSEQLGINEETLKMLLNAYGLLIPGLEASTADLLAFADAAGAVTTSAEGIKQVDLAAVIQNAFANGATQDTVWDLVNALTAAQEKGELQLVVDEEQVQNADDVAKELISNLDETDAKHVVDVDDKELEEAVSMADYLRIRLDKLDGKTVTIKVAVRGDGTAQSEEVTNGVRTRVEQMFSSGTNFAPGGDALLNEEGAEIIQAGGKAWIAGNGMPTVANIPRGAKIWTAEETKAILGNSDLSALYKGISAFAGGTNVPSAISSVATKTLWESANLFADTSEDETLKGLQGIVSLRKAELELLEENGASVAEQARKQREIQEAIVDVVNRLKETGGKQEDIVSLAAEWYQIESSIDELLDTQSAEQEEHLKELEEKTSLLESELSLLEAGDKSVKSQILKQREIRQSLQEQINYLKSIGGSQEDINKLKKQQLSIDKDIASLEKSLYENLQTAVQNRMDSINEKREKELSLVDEKIAKLQEEHDLQQKNNELEEKQLAVQKAKEELANAKKQRTVRVFNARTGRWEWTYNASTVQSAREAYQTARDDLKNYRSEERYQQRIAKLEERQDKINAKYDEQIAKWQKVLDALEEPVKSIQASLNEIERNATKAMLPTIRNINKALKGLGIAGIETTGLYDAGGILKGLGGIKATAEDEMVLPPDITKKMLSPIGSATFSQRLGELRYLYGAAGNLAGYANNAIGSQHNGDVYSFGNITLSKEQAKSTTVYELARMSRGLRSYNSAM